MNATPRDELLDATIYPAIGTAAPHVVVYDVSEGHEAAVAVAQFETLRTTPDTGLIEHGFARVSPWHALTDRTTYGNAYGARVIRTPYVDDRETFDRD